MVAGIGNFIQHSCKVYPEERRVVKAPGNIFYYRAFSWELSAIVLNVVGSFYGRYPTISYKSCPINKARIMEIIVAINTKLLFLVCFVKALIT